MPAIALAHGTAHGVETCRDRFYFNYWKYRRPVWSFRWKFGTFLAPTQRDVPFYIFLNTFAVSQPMPRLFCMGAAGTWSLLLAAGSLAASPGSVAHAEESHIES